MWLLICTAGSVLPHDNQAHAGSALGPWFILDQSPDGFLLSLGEPSCLRNCSLIRGPRSFPVADGVFAPLERC